MRQVENNTAVSLIQLVNKARFKQIFWYTKNMATKFIGARISAELVRKLKHRCVDRNVTLQHLIGELIEREVGGGHDAAP